MLRFDSLTAPLRLITGIGAAQVVVTVAVLLFKDVPWRSVAAGVRDGYTLQIPLPFVAIAALVLVSGWAYLLTASLHLPLPFRVALLTLASVSFWLASGRGAGAAAAALPILGLWGYSLATPRRVREIPLPLNLLAIGGLVLAVHLTPFISQGGDAWTRLAIGIAAEITLLIPFLLPLLVLAGLDLAEISGAAGARMTSSAAARVSPRTLAAGVLVLALSMVALQLGQGATPGPGLLIAAAFLTLLGFAARRSGAVEPAGPEPPFRLMLLLAGLLFLIPALLILTIAVLSAQVGGRIATATAGMGLQGVWALAGVAAASVGAVRIVHARRRSTMTLGRDLFVLVFGLWMLLTVAPPAALLSLLTGTAAESHRPLIALSELEIAAGGLGAAMVIHAAYRRTFDARKLIFLGSALLGLRLMHLFHELYRYEIAGDDLLMLAQVGFLVVLGASGFLGFARARGRGMIGAGVVAAAIAATGLLAWHGSGAGLLNSSQYVIFGAALIWDLLMSGGRFTNRDTPSTPRSARVLLYMGYISLVAAAFLWMNGLAGLEASSAFNDDVLPLYGLIVFGTPVLLFVWTRAASQLWTGGVLHSNYS